MTDKEKQREIKVGITVLIALAIFIFVMMWAKNFSFGSDTQTVKVRFDNVSGLYLKDKVTVNGLEKGFVSDMKIDGNSVIAELTLSRDVDLKKDAVFTLEMLDLMGGKKIEIKPGVASEKLDLSEIHEGKFTGDLTSAMAMFTGIQKDLTSIIKQTEKITTTLNGLLGDKNFGEKITATLDELNSTLAKTNAMLDENQEDLRNIVKNGAEFSDSLSVFWRKNSKNFSEFIARSQNTLAVADSVLNELNSLLKATNGGENNAGKIINDESYLEKLNATLENLNELVKILKKQLKGEGINVKTNIF